MKKITTILLLLLITGYAFSQQTIKGRVVASFTGAPIQGCSVFINNTSKGTISDIDGRFQLNDIPAGRYELIISSIGYETYAYPFSEAQLPLQIKAELQLKVKELQNVVAESSVEEGWDKWGKLFTDNFIGSTPNAAQCKIKNENKIHFRFFKKSNRVVAYADEPIILENKALGYRISYQLEEFEVNFKTRISLFFGYPFFEDINKDRKSLLKRWQRNRDKAYYGSMMHFLHSVYVNDIREQGFEVRRMAKIPNEEKERVKQLYSKKTAMFTTNNGITVRTAKKDTQLPADSAEYYERIMQQDDFKEIYGQGFLTADSIVLRTEGAYKFIFFNDYLFITYTKETEDPAYLSFKGQNRNPTFQQSYIIMPNHEPIDIDVNGRYPPEDILSLGYWSWSEKMADLLPLGYTPLEKN
ncbi:MAG: carboxypeptidase-like regulatory domain-containing protein [Bacteroidia bacterium]|nr:carboxypeptidase-like regulatory domain-containing protein [Bacteroidia bacterium]